MKPLTAEEIAEFRKLIAHLKIPEVRANMRELMLASGASRVLDEVERSRALLKRIEWEGRDERFESAVCPECRGMSDHQEARALNEQAGHRPGCELAALLGGQ